MHHTEGDRPPYFVEDDGHGTRTLWREEGNDFPYAVLTENLGMTGPTATSPEAFALACAGALAQEARQPEAQLAADLVRAEAALARVRSLHVDEDGTGYCPECGAKMPCPTLAALDGTE